MQGDKLSGMSFGDGSCLVGTSSQYERLMDPRVSPEGKARPIALARKREALARALYLFFPASPPLLPAQPI